MTTLIELGKMTVTLHVTPIGRLATGVRVDVPYEGTATSEHWDGERPVVGVDYVTIGSDGIQQLEIRGRIGVGRETVSYRALGRGGDEIGVLEVMVFETAAPDLAFLNSAVGVAVGARVDDRLDLTISLVSP